MTSCNTTTYLIIYLTFTERLTLLKELHPIRAIRFINGQQPQASGGGTVGLRVIQVAPSETTVRFKRTQS